ncbi:uncharacterized protein [Macrobrachium rosenbergii]|uniref:uncharacterized protein n=1 Tax=Macrobrachium rosenbergii TaxID=79674 RepID=UPI0034D562A7
MKRCLESFLLALLAITPSILAIFSMHQYGQFGVSCALVLSGIYLLILATVLSTRCCRQRNASNTDGDQESPMVDSPPSYEVVTSKPPPYHLLYAVVLPSGEVASATTTAKCAPAAAAVQNTCTEGDASDTLMYTWLEDTCDDSSLPSYSEAVAPSSQDPIVVSHLTD